MKLSILDQSPIRADDTPRQALQETLELARVTEKLGYHRFWVSEHHSMDTLAGSAPEVLLAAIGAATNTIRIGSGGIMLPHYSAFKVAETFSLLSTLYPGRVDLGIGRAPGSAMQTAVALATDGRPKFERFPQLVDELGQMLHNPDYQPKITPRAPEPPPVWMLGSSQDSAMLAAHFGLPYNFALFINTKMGPQIFDLYRKHFEPSEQLAEPHTMLTVNVVCAETQEQAARLARSRALAFLRLVTGQPNPGVPSPEEAENYPYSPQEAAFLNEKLYNSAIGTPEQVKTQLEEMAALYGADEIMTVTITYSFEDRVRSYALLAEAFGLGDS